MKTLAIIAVAATVAAATVATPVGAFALALVNHIVAVLGAL